MWDDQRYTRILSVRPCHGGFGFAVLESRRLLDWGVARVWGKSDKEFLARVESLVDRYPPDLLVLPDDSHYRLRSRPGRRCRLLADQASGWALNLVRVSRSTVHTTRQKTKVTKREVAIAVTQFFPELKPYVPPARKPWMSEDPRTSIFEAVAMTLAETKPATQLD